MKLMATVAWLGVAFASTGTESIPVPQPIDPAAIRATGSDTSSRWLANSRSLNERGLALLSEDPSGAYLAFSAALELDPSSIDLLFNTGSAALAAGQPSAVGLLSRAAASEAHPLAARAAFNLGTAHMAAESPAAASEAFKEALRRDPDFTEARVNLEIALAQLEADTANQQDPQQVPGPAGNSPPPPGPGESEQRPSDSSDGSGSSPSAAGSNRLPQFENQEELSAEEAAAILEAVENLERQQRSELAKQKQRSNASGDKDW